VVISALLVLPAAVMSAEEIGPVQAIELALRANPNLLAARNGISEAEAHRRIARSQFLPRLTLNHTWMRTDQPVAAFGALLNQAGFTMEHFSPDRLNDPEAIDDQYTQVVLQQPVFNGGKQWLGLSMAGTGVEIAEQMVAEAEHEIIFQTVKAYFDYILAREGLAVAQEAVEMGETTVGMIEHLLEQGVVVRSDLLSARVQLARFRQQELEARTGKDLALRAFNLILGDPEGDYVPAGTFEPASCPSVALTDLQMDARSRRPALQRLRRELELAEARRKMARTEFLPNLNLQATWDRHSEDLTDGDDSYTVAAALSWNLFKGGGDRAQMAVEEHARRRILEQIRALEQQIDLEVEQAYRDLWVATEQVAVAQAVIGEAEENLKIVRSRYEQGMTTILDLLGAQLALSGARMDLLQAQHAAVVGQAALCKATGNIRDRWRLEQEQRQ
jgi:outer membrane protein TolC